MGKVEKYYTSHHRWTRGVGIMGSRNNKGEFVSYAAPRACRHCISNVVQLLYKIDAPILYSVNVKLDEFARSQGYGSIFEWNDNPKRKFSEVKKLVQDLGI